MTTQLIPVFTGQINNQSVQLVDARLLHEFLEVITRFNDWIKDRIKDYDFIENQDFISFTEKSVKLKGGRPSKEYHLTLDMAKELAMVERNEQGRKARRYFIACERQLLTLEARQLYQLKALKTHALRANKYWSEIVRYKKIGLNHVEIGKLLSRDVSSIRRQVRQLEECGLIAYPQQQDLLMDELL